LEKNDKDWKITLKNYGNFKFKPSSENENVKVLKIPDIVRNKTNFGVKINAKLNDKTFLITGGSGNLASSFISTLKRYAPNARIIHPSMHDLNVEDAKSFELFRSLNPDFVLHCAAKVNADFCERNYHRARVNIVQGTLNAHKFSVEVGAKFFYPQSFLIFDGVDSPTTENTIPNPLSKYGELKLEAENLIVSSQQTLVVRMGGFFGGESKDKNFVGKMYKLFHSTLINKGHKIEVGERIWQPTYTKDLAENILLLIALDKAGIYNMASIGHATFLEVAQTMAKALDITSKLKIEPFPEKSGWKLDVAKRPRSVQMSNSRLVSEGIDLQRNWKIALIEYLNSPYFKKF
jgi:dTDP-4-dehydrorhamnose reductase